MTFLDKGQLTTTGDSNADYEFASSKDFFSYPANLITGLGGVSGGRILIGSKAALQALSLTNPQSPLVRSAPSSNSPITIPEIVGHNFLSQKADVAGEVTEVARDHITVKTGKGNKVYELYDNYSLGQKTYLSNKPKVKVGDKVKKGDILATSNYTDSEGVAALGTNLRTAVMPYRSFNFEDAFVLTESGAKKLEAEQMIRVQVEKRMGLEIDRNKFISLFPNVFTNKQLQNIGPNGVVKQGSKVEYGDPLILALAPKSLKSTDVAIGRLTNILKNAFNEQSTTWEYATQGEVIDVSVSKDFVTINIKTRRPLQVGDKVSNPFGAKGITGNIISDSLAPRDKDGKPVDVILNSMSVTSRVAPALINSLALGKVAEKTGKPVTMAHFQPESVVEYVEGELKKHNISDVEELYDPLTGQTSQVLVGPLYYTRMAHIAEDKESYRASGVGYDWNRQPAKLDGESAKRLGNLGTSALLSHGATEVLKNIATVKSTKNDEYWRNLKLGLPAPSPQPPFIFNKFLASLQGAGVNVTKRGTNFDLLPMTDKDVMELSAGVVSEPLTFQAKKGQLIPEKGGLFDPIKVGIYGEKFTHMDLASPIPNPISEDYLRKLLGVTKTEYMELVKSGGIVTRLKAIDVDKALAEQEAYLKTGKKTKKEDALKLVVFLRTLKKNGMTPADLILTKVPIIPAVYRPAMVQGDFSLSSDVNYLYKDLLMTSKALKDPSYEMFPDEVKDELKQKQYEAVRAVYGLGDPIVAKNKEKDVKGLLRSTFGIKGGSAKGTMFQSKVVNKPMDLVGRAVLAPSAFLDLDEAAVPEDTLWKAYSPFIFRRLIRRGIPATQVKLYIDGRHPLAQEALFAELKERPAIISRDPALHKYNLMGFYLKPNPDPKDKTIKLNPLVFKGMSADNDGDQLNINVPAGDGDRLEVINKMLPSRNILGPKAFKPMFVPSNEAGLGLYQSSTETKGTDTGQQFDTAEDAEAAFHKGQLSIGDRVTIK